MIVTRLALRKFRSHQETDLELGPLTLILGPNGSGKSTVLDALSYLTLGVCRGTDAAGRGADGLVSLGQTGGMVRAEIQGLGLLERPVGEGPASPLGKKIATALAPHLGKVAGPETFRVLMCPASFVAMATNQQAALVSALAAPDDLSQTIAPLLKDIITEDIPSTLAGLDALDVRYREARTELKRSLQQVTPPEVTDPRTLDELSAAHAEAQEQVDALVRLIDQAKVKPETGPKEDPEVRALLDAPKMACPKCKTMVRPVGGDLLLEAVVADRVRLLNASTPPAAKQPTLQPVGAPALEDLKARLAEARQKVTDLDRLMFVRQEVARVTEKRAGLQRELDRHEKVIAVLAPKGPARKAMAEHATDGKRRTLAGLVGEIRASLGWHPAEMDTQTWTFSVHGIRSVLLSRSEKWRLAFSLHLALAAMGPRILLLDDMETVVDPEERGIIADAIEKAVRAGYIDQAIMAVGASQDRIAEVLAAGPPEAGWTRLVVGARDGRSETKAA